MALRLHSGQALPSTAAGRLSLLEIGGDPTARTGAVWPLKNQHHPWRPKPAMTSFCTTRWSPVITARLRWDGVGWWLEDLGSTNGTLINGQRIAARTPQKISAGARLQLGDMVFELQD
jgi:hypothetical protein